MGDKTGISWADATWNPIVGCSVKSPGCTFAFAWWLWYPTHFGPPAVHWIKQDHSKGRQAELLRWKGP